MWAVETRILTIQGIACKASIKRIQDLGRVQDGLVQYYQSWQKLCYHANKMNARRPNIPEGITEALYCTTDPDHTVFVKKVRPMQPTKSQIKEWISNNPYDADSSANEPTFTINGHKYNRFRELIHVPKVSNSFDIFHTQKESCIQVKAASILPDLTTINPKSYYDEIVFIDMSGNSSWKYQIYEITDYFKQQLKKPKISIYKEIIEQHNIRPSHSGNI